MQKFLLDFFFPTFCLNCGDNGAYLCPECTAQLEKYTPECFLTRQPSREWKVKPKNAYFSKVRYIYKYSHIIHQLLIDIKYNLHYDKFTQLFRLLENGNMFVELEKEQFDFVTFPGVHKSKVRERGFNHNLLLSNFVARQLNLDSIVLFHKIASSKSQIALKREERLVNLQDKYQLDLSKSKRLTKSKKVLIVDDICTTGATLNTLAKLIKTQFPLVEVQGFCLSRGEA